MLSPDPIKKGISSATPGPDRHRGPVNNTRHMILFLFLYQLDLTLNPQPKVPNPPGLIDPKTKVHITGLCDSMQLRDLKRRPLCPLNLVVNLSEIHPFLFQPITHLLTVLAVVLGELLVFLP